MLLAQLEQPAALPQEQELALPERWQAAVAPELPSETGLRSQPVAAVLEPEAQQLEEPLAAEPLAQQWASARVEPRRDRPLPRRHSSLRRKPRVQETCACTLLPMSEIHRLELEAAILRGTLLLSPSQSARSIGRES